MDFFTFDEEYVQRLREGDPQTVEHFCGYFQPLLLIWLRTKLRSIDEVDDLSQEVYLRFFRALRSPDGGPHHASKLGAYVYSCSKNVLHEWYRRKGRTESIDEDRHDFSFSIDFDEEMIRSEERARVRLVLSELSKKDADILRARFLEECPADEVCEKFGVNAGYLRVLLFRARAKFREAWLKDPDPAEPEASDETDPDKPSLPN
ncbi:MAG TPA: sigma-70 family RNA polymerase sigma factor [Thermoanaerobaculia bacterium]|jgi:RNA polymerase sigma factor (sigma-70 family)|nr:sigma-70 family RNA polymerase sigma factor [Thermoanaerobaculia bacterium]